MLCVWLAVKYAVDPLKVWSLSTNELFNELEEASPTEPACDGDAYVPAYWGQPQVFGLAHMRLMLSDCPVVTLYDDRMMDIGLL